MRILIVSDYGTLIGGAEISMLSLREGLRARGHDARVFASNASSGIEPSFADYTCMGTTGRLRTVLQTANPWAYWDLRKVLADFRPDVVHVLLFLTQLSPLILPLLREWPSLYNVVWYRPICPKGTKMLPDHSTCQVRAGLPCYQNGCLPLRDWAPLMLQMNYWRRRIQHFDVFVANSNAVRLHLQAEGIGPVEVIPHGVPTRPADLQLASKPTVVFAGRLVAEKGVDVLVRAFADVAARVPQARLLIAGDGPDRSRIDDLMENVGVSSNVDLLGYVTHAEMERLFAGAWVQAVPSLWQEPLGIVAAEAMMRGTAVVASDTGGLREVVDDNRTGFLVPPGDSGMLAEAILRIVSSRHMAETMGRAGRERALTTFSDQKVTDQFVRLYERLSESRTRSRVAPD